MQFKFLALGALVASAVAAPTTALTGWTVKNFRRNCTDPKICTYYFSVDLGDGSAPHQCTITDNTTPNSALLHPWYNYGCQEGVQFAISWGWDYNGDFTVMTVVKQDSQTEAFFGYSHPNANYSSATPIISYADVGPNAVQPVKSS